MHRKILLNTPNVAYTDHELHIICRCCWSFRINWVGDRGFFVGILSLHTVVIPWNLL